MRLSIDRFEGSLAVCETPERYVLRIERARLPEGAKEGDLVELFPDGSASLLPEDTAALRKNIANRLKRLAGGSR